MYLIYCSVGFAGCCAAGLVGHSFGFTQVDGRCLVLELGLWLAVGDGLSERGARISSLNWVVNIRYADRRCIFYSGGRVDASNSKAGVEVR